MMLSLEEILSRAASPQRAEIRENECIGCTKCIQACPFDVIIGGAKQMHTVFSAECTGCGLCVPSCPVDCIDLIPISSFDFDRELAKQNYNRRNHRLACSDNSSQPVVPEANSKRSYIQEAVKRAKLKRLNSAVEL